MVVKSSKVPGILPWVLYVIFPQFILSAHDALLSSATILSQVLDCFNLI